MRLHVHHHIDVVHATIMVGGSSHANPEVVQWVVVGPIVQKPKPATASTFITISPRQREERIRVLGDEIKLPGSGGRGVLHRSLRNNKQRNLLRFHSSRTADDGLR
ncbi:DNA topoisomerase IV subunit A [Sesbania bispinosa]|nr:DNA topoisomerase IV subunit A [Sesbania bispinosa]